MHFRVESKQQELEEKIGYPIQIVEDNSLQNATAVTQLAWKHQQDFHLIKHRTQNTVILPHILAHELEHIALEDAARKSGRNRSFITTPATRATAIRSIQADIYKLNRRGIDEATLTRAIISMVDGLANQVFNVPLDMVIEQTLFEKYAAIRPSQLVWFHDQHLQNLTVLNDPQLKQLTPPRIFKASTALNCAAALSVDFLYGDRTQYAAPYRSFNAFNTGQRLFKIWQDSLGVFEAGDEYILVDEFARELKLQDWYEWKTDIEAALENTDRPEGTSNPDLLKSKDTASVWHLLAALERFADLPVEDVREITFEIATIGINGIDYASTEQQYGLRTIPDEKFSGLQLLCLMYVGFKTIDSSADISIDLQAPYDMALELFQAKQNKTD